MTQAQLDSVFSSIEPDEILNVPCTCKIFIRDNNKYLVVLYSLPPELLFYMVWRYVWRYDATNHTQGFWNFEMSNEFHVDRFENEEYDILDLIMHNFYEEDEDESTSDESNENYMNP